MIRVEQADRIIAESIVVLPDERLRLADAGNRVLREPVFADRDLPPFNRVAMDGIALSATGCTPGQARFRIEATVPAGHPPPALQHPTDGCLQVMTGAMLPEGCDCVAPVEHIRVEDHHAHLDDGLELRPWKHVHRQGSDHPATTLLLTPGFRLTAPRIGIAAAAGLEFVQATRLPVVGIVSNGDELIDLGQPVLPFQIRPSNTYALRAALERDGIRDIRSMHLPDDPDAIRHGLASLMESCDVLILSGGVSAGTHDYIPSALEQLGVERLFHKVAQRPGKPMWFGLAPGARPVFALPGNPVSTLACYYRYVRPHLDRIQGTPPPPPRSARLHVPYQFEKPLTLFLPVAETLGPDGPCVTRIIYHGSGDYSSLDHGHGFLELPADQNEFPPDAWFPYYPWI